MAMVVFCVDPFAGSVYESLVIDTAKLYKQWNWVINNILSSD